MQFFTRPVRRYLSILTENDLGHQSVANFPTIKFNENLYRGFRIVNYRRTHTYILKMINYFLQHFVQNWLAKCLRITLAAVVVKLQSFLRTIWSGLRLGCLHSHYKLHRLDPRATGNVVVHESRSPLRGSSSCPLSQKHRK
jgi:hypothetical protein